MAPTGGQQQRCCWRRCLVAAGLCGEGFCLRHPDAVPYHWMVWDEIGQQGQENTERIQQGLAFGPQVSR